MKLIKQDLGTYLIIILIWIMPSTMLMLMLVIMNSLIGAIQEYKANRVLDSLKKMTTNKVKVIRENKKTLIDSDELTIGDIIAFEAGDNIYADARIIEANGLKLLESTLKVLERLKLVIL